MSLIRLGFVPLTDCAPLVVASELGLFAAQGLEVSLSREMSWATIRDKVAVGALEGAHMLAPMALAATAGTDDVPSRTLAMMALARNGSSITLSNALAEAVQSSPAYDGSPQAKGTALRAVIAERRARSLPPLTLAVVFPYSTHNYLLRYWLASAGIHPERDLRLMVVPPPRMVEFLKARRIDGFSVGAPWGSKAEAEQLGHQILQASSLWPMGPDKVLGMRAASADQLGDQLPRLLAALEAAAQWADDPANLDSLLSLLSAPAWVGQPSQVLRPALAGEITFAKDVTAAPRLAHGAWLAGQMLRWGHVEASTDPVALAQAVYRHPYLTCAERLDEPVASLFDGGTTFPHQVVASVSAAPFSRTA